MEEQELNRWNHELSSAIASIKPNSGAALKYSLTIDIKDTSNPKNLKEITLFYNIMSGFRSSSPQKKILQLKSKLMEPEKIDIIITLIKNINTMGGTKKLQATVISGPDEIIDSEYFPQNKGVSSKMKSRIKKSIIKILNTHFK
jgi:hypothetical protein